MDGVAAALDATAIEAADAIYVLRHGRQTVVRRAETAAGDLDQADGDGLIRAPMHGKVLALLVAEGDRVEKGQRLAIIEAMKMEHALTAPRAGRVAGDRGRGRQPGRRRRELMTIEPDRVIGTVTCRFISSSSASACDSVEDLEDWIKLKLKEQKKRGVRSRSTSTPPGWCPSAPRKSLDGGSIFWVIRGEILCRERILDIRPFVDKDGIGRCRLVLEPKCVPVRPRPYPRVSGLALSRAEGCAARSRPRRARRRATCRSRCGASCASWDCFSPIQ